jgi:hypothetical protein
MKRKIKEIIHKINFDGEYAEIRFSDFPKDIKEDDIINIVREESYSSENDSYDGYSELWIIRERDETDEEYQKRQLERENYFKERKKNRYETYLKLKSEFEDNHNLFEKK